MSGPANGREYRGEEGDSNGGGEGESSKGKKGASVAEGSGRHSEKRGPRGEECTERRRGWVERGGVERDGVACAAPGETASGNKPRLEPLQKIESGKGHGGREPRAMERVGNEMSEGRGGGG